MRKNNIFLVFVFLLILIGALFAQEKLTILHWNDFHAHNIPYRVKKDGKEIEVGGYATLAGYIDSLRPQLKNVALVNAGDDFQGSPISSITKGVSQIELLNLINPDVFTIGNHEFDYGDDNLRKAISRARFPIISANLFDKSKGKLFVKPYLIKQYGKIKVGYIGLMTRRLKELTMPDNIRTIKILDPFQVVKKYTAMIKDSVDIIVIVSHMGIEDDKELAAKGSGFQVIIGGHSHTTLSEPVIVNNVIICQAGSYGKYLGKLDLLVDVNENKIIEYKGRLIETVVKNIKPDPIVKAKVDSLERQLDSTMSEVLGELKTDWIRIRRGESNVGNWEADVMREFAGTDIAFQNAGGIRKNLLAGKITVRDMWELNPFGNRFVVFKITGKELRTILETNSNGKGEFLQVSGLKYTYDPNRPVGQRVVKILVHDKPVDDDATYTVCTNNFLTDHFYSVFGLSPRGKEFKTLNPVDRDVFIEAVKKQKIISSKIEGRIVAIK